jgi:hypothetical protein
LIGATLSNEFTKKPKSKKGKGKKGKSSKSKKQTKKLKRLVTKKTEASNSFESPVDLDVMIRMKFARYGTNMLANFVSGILSAFYNSQFQFLQKQDNSQTVLKKHIRCIRKGLGSIFNNQQLIRVFENKLLFGGIYPFKKQIRNYFIFNHRYKVLRRKNRILSIIRRLKRVTGTFVKNRIYREQQKRIVRLYRRRFRVKGAAKKIIRLNRLSRRKFIKKQKKATKKSFAAFKLKSFKKRISKWKKSTKANKKVDKIIGKHSLRLIAHAKFMTYAFRKIWFYSSFFTKKVLSCAVSASSKHRTIQKAYISVLKRNNQVACPYNYVDVLTMMLKHYSVRNAFNSLFYKLLVRGVKTKLLYKVRWFRVGQALFNAHSVLETLCPWF